MDMTTTSTNLVNQAKSWIGYKESDGSHKKIIDVYNAHKPLPQGYHVTYEDAWCATFVSACFIKCNATDIMPKECSCPRMIELCKTKGIWIENENIVPAKGDIVFYDWQDSGSGDNKGVADHVGIVEKVNAKEKTFTAIEGNYGNCVKRRTLDFNAKYLRGFARPKYQAAAKTVSNTAAISVGDTVKLKAGAAYYGGGKIPSWLFNKTLYVRQIDGSRVVISTMKIGAVTGAVEKKWLKKV